MTGPAVGSGRPSRTCPQPGFAGHVGSHSRYSAGCRCAACTGAHAGYLADWRAGRLVRSAAAGPVRAHLAALVASGLVLGYLADEAGVPRRTVYRLMAGSTRISPDAAGALLALRPLQLTEVLPTRVRLAEAGRPAGRRRAAAATELHAGSARQVAGRLGVSARTVERWRAGQIAGRTA